MKKSQFSEEQIVRILQEAAHGEKSQSQLCREHSVSENIRPGGTRHLEAQIWWFAKSRCAAIKRT